jgi:GxxExxY protein
MDAVGEKELTERIIGCAIEVHRILGPGLLESAYELCLCQELKLQGIPFERQVALPIFYKNVQLEAGYVMDIVVANCVVLELKAVPKILPVHEAQLLSYLKLSRYSVGLLLDFHAPTLVEGIRRRIL